MKLCDECGKNPANIHLTQIMQNETHVSHLCEECAKKKGISISINDDAGASAQQVTAPVVDKTCRHCGYTYENFRSKGWLGCSDCYDAFQKEIDELLIQMHGSTVHKGKQYMPRFRTQQALGGEVKRLRQELAIAIKNEAFEQAATIRDAIHSIKQMGVQ